MELEKLPPGPFPPENNLVHSASLRSSRKVRGRWKRVPITLQTICPNRGHVFLNKLRKTRTAILKTAVLRLVV